jgi:tetratricopeptide (TPR) repeat protein
VYDKSYLNDEYKMKRKEIENIYYNEELYEKALKYTKDFLELIKKENASQYNFHFTYMMFSKIYNSLGEKDKAIAYAKMSRKYLFNYREIKTLVIENKWQHAMCYKTIDNKKALAYFNDCFNVAIETKFFLHASLLLEEIALIENDIQKMLLSIHTFITEVKIDDKTYRQNRLDDLYCSLFKIYIENNQEISAYKILHNIKNEAKINELKLMMKLKISKFA